MYTTQSSSIFQPFVFSAAPQQQQSILSSSPPQQQPMYFNFPQPVSQPQQQQQMFFMPATVQQQQPAQQGKVPEATVLITKNKGANIRPSYLLLGCHLDATKQKLDQMNISHVVNCASELSMFQDGANSFSGRSVKYQVVTWSGMWSLRLFQIYKNKILHIYFIPLYNRHVPIQQVLPTDLL